MNPKTLLHGSDYNPEQWLQYPGIIDQDFKLLKEAKLNCLTIGVFSWASLEPEEGTYTFGWMDDIFDRAEKQGVRIILSTPSGGKPNWMAFRYPEIRRVNQEGRRDDQERRHNHCMTSSVYREKVRAINGQLAGRYGKRGPLAMWHVSNELNGYCYCDCCLGGFRQWLKEKYQTLDALNEAYWSRFWSHTYTSWEEIRRIDPGLGGLVVDWKRFMTAQCASFIRNELEPVRRHSPDVPSTINMMGLAPSYDYWELAKEVDVISWDTYPAWNSAASASDETAPAMETAFSHDMFRSMKRGRPFYVMETTPSQVNWRDCSPLRRPGVHQLGGMQALAHGSDSVCYFQLRKSRGSSEQFHGAVIDHVGHGKTRVFREVADLGRTMEKLAGLAGSTVEARVALVFDWNVYWALDAAQCPQNANKNYAAVIMAHYRPFWEAGIAVDVINAEAPLDAYRLVIAPQLFLLSEKHAERLDAFVKNGGALVATYNTGMVEETNLAVLGGVPGPLRKVLGLWVEESDALPPAFRRTVVPRSGASCGLNGSYEAGHILDVVHTEGADVLAEYGDDFYKGYPALTRNRRGKGEAWYITSRNDDRFTGDFMRHLIRELALPRALQGPLPQGVTAHARNDGHSNYLLVLNFNAVPATCPLEEGNYVDAVTGLLVVGPLTLPAYGYAVLRR